MGPAEILIDEGDLPDDFEIEMNTEKMIGALSLTGIKNLSANTYKFIVFY